MPAYMAERKRQDIREAIQAGMTSAEIQQLLQVSAGTIVNIKRELGIPIRPTKRPHTGGPMQAAAQPSWDGRHYSVAEAYIDSLDADTPAPTAPPAPTPPLSPAAYMAAFENRVLEYHALLKQKDATIERLEKECAKLLAEYAQIVHQQANWTGPTSIMNQSLGNGG